MGKREFQSESSLRQRSHGREEDNAEEEARQSVREEQRRVCQSTQVHVRERKGHLRQMPERVHQLRQKAVQKSHRHEEAHEKVGPGRQNGCKAAAKAMKKTFGIVTSARYPKGCFVLN